MNDFINFIEDCLQTFGIFNSKKMFGEVGIYLNSKIIGIVSDGEFYIKSKPETVKNYQIKGFKQFSYETKEGIFYLKYFRLGDEILENPDILKEYINNTY